MNKAIFLDRDGVLISDYHYNCDINKIKINNDILKLLNEFKNDYLFFVVTNQSGVARGYFSVQQLEAFNSKLLTMFLEKGICIEKVYYCPHYKYGINKYALDCNCRKPQIGLLKLAEKEYNLDLNKCFMIGDKNSDVECGLNANLKKSFNITLTSVEQIIKEIRSHE